MNYKYVIRLCSVLALGFVCLFAYEANAQTFVLDLSEGGGSLTARLFQLLFLTTVIALAPSALLTVTCFTRIVIVLSLLRVALGTQQSPPNQVMVALALFLSFFIMSPTLERAYDEGIAPLLNEEIDELEGISRVARPFHDFMAANVRTADLELFTEIAGIETVETIEEIPYSVMIPSFIISELRRAFEIGFLLFLPFVVLDLVVASVLMAMGMMMLPPVMISVPFKLIFFVLVDGWRLIAGSMVQGFEVPEFSVSEERPAFFAQQPGADR